MTTNINSLRKDLHQIINQTEDVVLLNKVWDFIRVLKKEKNRSAIVSKKEREIIDLGIQQLADNKGLPHDMVKASISVILEN